MKRIIYALIITIMSSTSYAGETYCQGLTTKDLVDVAVLDDFQKEICRMELLQCYSAFNVSGECDTQTNYGLIVLDPNTITIEPSATSDYGFKHIRKTVSSTCLEKMYGVDMVSDQGVYESINTEGAYIMNANNCVRQADTIIYSNRTGVLQTDWRKGPVVGTYTIQYSDVLTDDVKKTTITVKDTMSPRLSAVPKVAMYYPHTNRADIRIEDNYLPGYPSMKAYAILRDASGKKVSETRLSYQSGNTWSASVSNDKGSYIDYYVEDSSKNAATTSGFKINPVYK